jgi:hypothetical protein
LLLASDYLLLAMKLFVLMFFFSLASAASATAQTKSKNIVLLNSSGNTITLAAPSTITNNTISLPGTLGLQGSFLYISSVAGAVGTSAWLNPGTDGFILSLASGIPAWTDPAILLATNFWSLSGNVTTTAYNGTTGNYIGTTSLFPLVLATTNAVAQPIEFFTGSAERLRISSTGNIGIGAGNPTSPLHVTTGITASGGSGAGSFFNQTITAAANNDILYGANITPTFTNGAFTGLTNYALRSLYAGTFQSGTAVRGEASGNSGANGEIFGVWGIATSTTQAANTNAGTGIRAEGNNTTTDANSNIALQIVNGELVVGRQASNAANDNTAGNNILVTGEDDNNGLTDQGPSGIVDVTDGGAAGASNVTTNTKVVFNRYVKTNSIIFLSPMAGGTGTTGVGDIITYRISARANGSFTIEVRRNRDAGATGVSGTWRVGFLIVNPSK